MYIYTMLDSDQKLSQAMQNWKAEGITSLAMDFEGEFNLHIYGEHLCLVQLYDGKEFFLIDPFAVSPAKLKEFLEDGTVEKIMFDCASDSALVRKESGILMEGLYDIRVQALALGYTGNLTGLVQRYIGEENTEDAASKKKNQMTNWLLRPLKAAQVQYALGDVAHLFALKAFLAADVQEKGLSAQVEEAMKDVGKSKGPDKPGWTKFSSWKYLSKEEKVFLKHFFQARDTLARKYNVPAVRILDKHLLLDMAKKVPVNKDEFHVYCTKCAPQKLTELISALVQAKADAITELSKA